jgi:hypothetical protein
MTVFRHKPVVLLSALFLFLGLQGCYTVLVHPPAPDGTVVTYENDCAACHGAGAGDLLYPESLAYPLWRNSGYGAGVAGGYYYFREVPWWWGYEVPRHDLAADSSTGITPRRLNRRHWSGAAAVSPPARSDAVVREAGEKGSETRDSTNVKTPKTIHRRRR